MTRAPSPAGMARGLGRLAVDATLGATRVVETLHHNILRAPGVFGAGTQAPAGGITGLVYRSVRGVTRVVGGSVDRLLAQLTPWLPATGPRSPQGEAMRAALNGLVGDHLAASGNPLALRMCLRHDGIALPADDRAGLRRIVPARSRRLSLMVHGLCMNDLQWRHRGHDHGAALARDAGFTPVHVHYNTGLDIATNGRELAGQLEALLRAWPDPIDEVAAIGFSMGGLVLRSACRHAQDAGHSWLGALRRVVFLGTPHRGAALERGGAWLDDLLERSPYTLAFAPLGRLRSAGIQDLRRRAPAGFSTAGSALPAHVDGYVIAGSLARRRSPLRDRWIGDGLVPLASALGVDADGRDGLGIAQSRRWVAHGTGHLDLLGDSAVYARLHAWLAAPRQGLAPARRRSPRG